MKSLVKVSAVLLIGLSFSLASQAQTTKADKKAAKVAEITKLVTSKNFVFKASTAMPGRGMPTKSLTSDYDLTIAKDTVIAYLPYFGRSYMADYGSTDGGIKFNTTKVDYKSTPGKKGGYEIVITPKNSNMTDAKGVKTMRLDISSDGYASLQVISLNRDPISFNGDIQPRPKPKH